MVIQSMRKSSIIVICVNISADPRALLPADGYSTVMTVSTSQIFNVFMKYNFLQNLNSLFYFDSKYCN